MMSEAAIMAVIALFGSGITMYFQARQRRDQLQYDQKFTLLEAKQKHCEEQDEAKGRRIAALESHIVTLTAADARDKAEILAKIESSVRGKPALEGGT